MSAIILTPHSYVALSLHAQPRSNRCLLNYTELNITPGASNCPRDGIGGVSGFLTVASGPEE